MKKVNSILVYREGSAEATGCLDLSGSLFSWASCKGKGSFFNSPLLKKWADKEIELGAECLVVDLSECSGMDSTFMGTLAGISMRLMNLSQGKSGVLQIADPGEKNRKSLEGLGLDSLMQIDPEDAPWKGRQEEIKKELHSLLEEVSTPANAPYVLEAHQVLCEVDKKNREKFGTVLDFLEAEVKAKNEELDRDE